jgi:hypothetical protein
MAATVLNSKRAIEMSVFVVRAFVRMREMLAKNRQLAARINELDRRLETHDTAIQDIIDAIKELMLPGTDEAQDRFSVAAWQDVKYSPAATHVRTTTCGAAGTSSRLPALPWLRHLAVLPEISQRSPLSAWARVRQCGTALG